MHKEGLRRYLLGKTQHVIGGFAKAPGELPGRGPMITFPSLENKADRIVDILHAYLGLATLSIIGGSDLPPLDPTFCMSKAAKANLARISWLKIDRDFADHTLSRLSLDD